MELALFFPALEVPPVPNGPEERPTDPKVEEEELREWRRRATDVVTTANAVVHLPLLVALLVGYGTANVALFRSVLAVAYLVIVACAVFRAVDARVRAWVLLGALYVAASVGAATLPQGPYIRALPMIAPMLAIGLLGVREARLCTLASAGVLVFAPFVPSLPALLQWLVGDAAQPSLPPATTWIPGAALTADMVVVMVLLERLYRFLLKAVDAQRHAAAERAAAGLRLEREIEARRRLEQEIARAADDERRHLGQEIHDGVCQQLTGALLRCQALETRLEKGPPLAPADVVALSSLLGETIHEARAVAHGLCPLEPTPDALEPALRSLAKRTQQTSGVACEFHGAGDLFVPDPTAAQNLYRITQEALSNAVRHAGASRITVELRGADDSLQLSVQDDGVGLPARVPSGGLGLRTMSYRAEVLEGELAIGPAPGGGTRVSCRVPRPAGGPPVQDRHLTPERIER